MSNMEFWDYVPNGKGDAKKKALFSKPVATVHKQFRENMGSVDQSDVKRHVMGLSSEAVVAWHKKQLAFLIESAIGNAHANYNLDPSTKAEYFTEWYNNFLTELLLLSPDLRIYKVSTPTRMKRKMSEEKEPDLALKRSH